MKRPLIVGLIVFLLVGGAVAWFLTRDDSTGNDDDPNDVVVELPDNVAGVAVGHDDLTNFGQIIQLSNLSVLLEENETNYTYFAPNDEAFEALDENTLTMLLSDNAFIQQGNLMRSHIVEGVFSTADLTDGQQLTNLNNNQLTVEIEDDNIFIVDQTGERAQLVETDIKAGESGDMIHVINKIYL